MQNKCKIDLKRKRIESFDADNSELKKYFISGISFKTTIEDFKELVSSLDINCTDVHVPFDESRGTIKGFAYITSADVDSVFKLDEYDHNGRILRVQTAKSADVNHRSKEDKEKDKEKINRGESDTIKLNDINTDLDDNFLKKFFGKVGKIRRIFNPKGKNFAYMSFSDLNDALKALKLDMTELGEETQAELDVKKEKQNGESDTIKLNDLKSGLDEKYLKKFFMKVGKIRRVFAPEDKNFAYVSFDDSKDAVKALKLDMSELGEDATAELDVKNPKKGGSRGGRGDSDRGGRGGGDRRGGGRFRGGDRGGRGGNRGSRGSRGRRN